MIVSDLLSAIVFGRDDLSSGDVDAIARGRVSVALWDDPSYVARVDSGHASLMGRVRSGEAIYGTTTGFGASCENRVTADDASALAMNLVRYHGCGTGRPFDPFESAAIVATRVASLARGWSGVRWATLERLVMLLQKGVLPVIPSEGSVGASGDLTPLSYVAAVLTGEREAYAGTFVLPAAEALRRIGLSPWRLEPKESLAIMNGTSVMTALACLAEVRATRLARLACSTTALMVDVLRGNPDHFDARIFAAKPHPGQALAAQWIREGLGVGERPRPQGGRIQDRYSLRCAPHVVGVLLDALPFFRGLLSTELNGASDNPLVDPETSDVLHGGNFYGGHIAFAMDGLKSVVVSVADLLERQLVLLLHPVTNNGLPENLVAVTGPERVAHHGFKAMEIAASALVAEAAKSAMPAAVFGRSTEGHNQDKVSLGTIAARDALRVLELAETVTAICLLGAAQGVDLRGGPKTLKGSCRETYFAVRELVPQNSADRRQDGDIQSIVTAIRSARFPHLSG